MGLDDRCQDATGRLVRSCRAGGNVAGRSAVVGWRRTARTAHHRAPPTSGCQVSAVALCTLEGMLFRSGTDTPVLSSPRSAVPPSASWRWQLADVTVVATPAPKPALARTYALPARPTEGHSDGPPG